MLEPMRWQRVERSCGAWPVRLLVDQIPRDQEALRGVLQARLGAHYEIQAAQRSTLGRVEEPCAQSGGATWLMLISQMDQATTVCPSKWNPLATRLFQDQEKRLITGLIGPIHVVRNETHSASRAHSLQLLQLRF